MSLLALRLRSCPQESVVVSGSDKNKKNNKIRADLNMRVFLEVWS